MHNKTNCLQMVEIQDCCYFLQEWTCCKDHTKGTMGNPEIPVGEKDLKSNRKKIPRKLYKSVKVFVKVSTSRKSLYKHGVTGRKKEISAVPKNIEAWLKITPKHHLDVPHSFWKKVLWTDETNVKKIHNSNVKRCAGSIMLRCCLRCRTPCNHWGNNDLRTFWLHFILFYRRRSRQQFMTSSLREVGWCNETQSN